MIIRDNYKEDDQCKTVGIGNIRMRMFDGHIRTLTNVRHVPDLKKNLFSLGALEAMKMEESKLLKAS